MGTVIIGLYCGVQRVPMKGYRDVQLHALGLGMLACDSRVCTGEFMNWNGNIYARFM